MPKDFNWFIDYMHVHDYQGVVWDWSTISDNTLGGYLRDVPKTAATLDPLFLYTIKRKRTPVVWGIMRDGLKGGDQNINMDSKFLDPSNIFLGGDVWILAVLQAALQSESHLLSVATSSREDWADPLLSTILDLWVVSYGYFRMLGPESVLFVTDKIIRSELKDTFYVLSITGAFSKMKPLELQDYELKDEIFDAITGPEGKNRADDDDDSDDDNDNDDDDDDNDDESDDKNQEQETIKIEPDQYMTVGDFLKQMPPTPKLKFKSHAINQKLLQSWIEHHPHKLQKTAAEFSRSFQYVTWDTWRNKLYALLKFYAKNHTDNWVFFLPLKVDRANIECKSNAWVTRLALEFIDDKLPSYHACKGVIFGHQSLEKSDIRRVMRFHEIRRIVLLDDASYSGSQIASTIEAFDINGLLDQLDIIIPYVSTAAQRRIALFSPSLLVDDKVGLVTTIETWREYLSYMPPSMLDEIETKILPPKTKKVQWTTYFQFKMPDGISIVENIRTGYVRTGDETSTRVKFIRNCHSDIDCPIGIYKMATPFCRSLAIDDVKGTIKDVNNKHSKKLHFFWSEIHFAKLQLEKEEENNNTTKRPTSRPTTTTTTTTTLYTREEALLIIVRALALLGAKQPKRIVEIFDVIEPYLDPSNTERTTYTYTYPRAIESSSVTGLNSITEVYRALVENQDVKSDRSYSMQELRELAAILTYLGKRQRPNGEEEGKKGAGNKITIPSKEVWEKYVKPFNASEITTNELLQAFVQLTEPDSKHIDRPYKSDL